MACARENARATHVHTTDRRRAYSDLAGFIAAATELHGGRYSYETASYVNAHTLLSITCPTHGVFQQSPTNHIQGKGCPKCKATAISDRCLKTTEAFVRDAEQVWGSDKYDYSLVSYEGAARRVRIKCVKHGKVFEQTPTNHLSGKEGCTQCNHMKSKGEDSVFEFLSMFTRAESRVKQILGSRELDIYLPDAKLAVEYCGEFHHSHKDADHERANKHKHFQKYRDCKAQGIRLITLYESEWKEHNYAVRRLLRNAVGKSKGKLMARKCELRKVTSAEARAFYDRYHPQGGSGHGEHYALFWKGKMVACMRFVLGANDRGAGAANRVWTLGRYATRITVAGAASKLFKAFLQEYNPPVVKSFSDNRFFDGGMYEQLGFVLDAEVPPDYQVWHQKLGVRPKPHFQRRLIPARIKELGSDLVFDPDTDPRTEAEITYALGAGRIYDCGKKRWVWTPNS